MRVKVWRIHVPQLIIEYGGRGMRRKEKFIWYSLEREIDLEFNDEQLLGFLTISESLIRFLAKPMNIDRHILNRFQLNSRDELRSCDLSDTISEVLQKELGDKIRVITPVDHHRPFKFWRDIFTGFYVKDAAIMYSQFGEHFELGSDVRNVYLPRENYGKVYEIVKSDTDKPILEANDFMENQKSLIEINYGKIYKYKHVLADITTYFNTGDFVGGINSYYKFIGLPDMIYGKFYSTDNRVKEIDIKINGKNVNDTQFKC